MVNGWFFAFVINVMIMDHRNTISFIKIHILTIMRLFNMLGYNTEFYWMSTLQNQSIFWTRRKPSPKYRLVLQCTNPNEFSIIYNHVKWPLYFTLTRTFWLSDSKYLSKIYFVLIKIFKRFVTAVICIKHKGDYCRVPISIFRILALFWKIHIWGSSHILKNPYFILT